MFIFGTILFIFLHKFTGFLKFAVKDCEAINVTDTTENSTSSSGIYLRTNERAAEAQNSPAWKHPKKDRYIFTTGSQSGWRIGKQDHLDSGRHYYKGRVYFIFKKLGNY